jgi:hypothetical protein
MLKIANSNLQSYKEIMQYSPSKPKSLVVKELNSVVRSEEKSSKKRLAFKRSKSKE